MDRVCVVSDDHMGRGRREAMRRGRPTQNGPPLPAGRSRRSDDRWARYFFIWPRSSPALLAAVWMLAYHSPAICSLACASVSVAEPSNGLLAAPPAKIGTATPAFLPAAAGPRKCAAVNKPDRPE